MWNNNKPIDLTSRGLTGQLPTLHAGIHKGYFVGMTVDNDGLQWITVVSDGGTHIEQSDLDVTSLDPQARIEFEVAPRGGVRLGMKGTRYALFDDDMKKQTDWMALGDIYEHIRENKPKLAGLCITWINTISSSTDNN